MILNTSIKKYVYAIMSAVMLAFPAYSMDYTESFVRGAIPSLIGMGAGYFVGGTVSHQYIGATIGSLTGIGVDHVFLGGKEDPNFFSRKGGNFAPLVVAGGFLIITGTPTKQQSTSKSVARTPTNQAPSILATKPQPTTKSNTLATTATTLTDEQCLKKIIDPTTTAETVGHAISVLNNKANPVQYEQLPNGAWQMILGDKSYGIPATHKKWLLPMLEMYCQRK